MFQVTTSSIDDPRRRLHLALAAGAALVLLPGAVALHGSARQELESELTIAAGRQVQLAQQVARLATTMERRGSEIRQQAGTLRDALRQARIDERTLATELAPGATPPLADALAAWQRAQARLKPVADLLLQRADQGGDGVPVAAAALAEVEDAADSAVALQAALADTVREAARERARHVRVAAAAACALLAALWAFVLGPLLARWRPAGAAAEAAPGSPPAPAAPAAADAFAGLAAAGAVHERVRRVLAHAARHPGYGFAVLFIDVDHLGRINDTLGHAAGDELLRQAAERIEDALRPGDAAARVVSALPVAERTAGDEFVVVLEGVRDEADARAVAQRLVDVLAVPYAVGPQPCEAGASIGIVTREHAAADADSVLRDAETAMLEAKRTGRRRCVAFDPATRERVLRLLEAGRDLRRAVQAREFFAVYQPVVDLSRGEMTAVEALLRWQHPVNGVLVPADFLQDAAEAGVLEEIGTALLHEVCLQFAAWRTELGARAPARLGVNLSRGQLRDPALPARVARLLQDSGLEPAALELEVTEAVAAQDPQDLAALQALKAVGVRLALDAFGSGQSSLSGLARLPLDTVKIDQVLVAQAGSMEVHRVLIEATIRVAQAQGMDTVAVGVEDAAQAGLLQRLQCRLAQGGLFARPMTAEELARWVLADRPAAVVTD